MTAEDEASPHEWCDGIRPYAPLSTLKPLSDGIWWVDGPVMRMSVGPVSLPFPTRMAIIRLRSGGLWVWSPTAPTPELFAEVDALGPVEHLVSPNRFHYAAIPAWKQRYPRATAWASPGVRERARSQNIDVAFEADLGDTPPPAWAHDLDQRVFRGSRFMEEVVFFHRASSTLIVADLVMALEPDRVRPRLRWLLTLGGTMWPGQTPREVRLTSWGRKAQARASSQHLLEWRPRQVLLAHGRCYLDAATARLERAFAWLR
ncbi:DUF4336 domain-containing protein [Pyxidicoccus fallax]|uniref:DUF4336 domain-containing protein n=1 Tax=Pyxidicoccus fallax TaxID=394095 RepID=A0A848LLK9_9BACT|nr:DUF4336 domain-containing protein [Pyxidicoccus fallax]NMO18543.1 DUF4336 domain-containing protein [Pyxidicoccus fallax]NPC86067.1 DUF4336 domain-containing protein [Pyxidicoccus fallax]